MSEREGSQRERTTEPAAGDRRLAGATGCCGPARCVAGVAVAVAIPFNSSRCSTAS